VDELERFIAAVRAWEDCRRGLSVGPANRLAARIPKELAKATGGLTRDEKGQIPALLCKGGHLYAAFWAACTQLEEFPQESIEVIRRLAADRGNGLLHTEARMLLESRQWQGKRFGAGS
jgi:hypothetical protein